MFKAVIDLYLLELLFELEVQVPVLLRLTGRATEIKCSAQGRR